MRTFGKTEPVLNALVPLSVRHFLFGFMEGSDYINGLVMRYVCEPPERMFSVALVHGSSWFLLPVLRARGSVVPNTEGVAVAFQ